LFCTSWLPQQNHKCIHPSLEHIWSKCEPTQETIRCNGTQELVPKELQASTIQALSWDSCKIRMKGLQQIF